MPEGQMPGGLWNLLPAARGRYPSARAATSHSRAGSVGALSSSQGLVIDKTAAADGLAAHGHGCRLISLQLKQRVLRRHR